MGNLSIFNEEKKLISIFANACFPKSCLWYTSFVDTGLFIIGQSTLAMWLVGEDGKCDIYKTVCWTTHVSSWYGDCERVSFMHLLIYCLIECPAWFFGGTVLRNLMKLVLYTTYAHMHVATCNVSDIRLDVLSRIFVSDNCLIVSWLSVIEKWLLWILSYQRSLKFFTSDGYFE